jgi:hypothetical protein
MSYKKVRRDYWYPPTSPGTLNPSFTTTSVTVPGGTVTFYVNPTWTQTMVTTKQYATMKDLLIKHNCFALPDESGEISRLD